MAIIKKFRIKSFKKSNPLLEVKNISIAFGDLSKIRKASIIKSMWSNYGKTFAEYLFLDKFRYDKFQEKQINILGIEKKEDKIFVRPRFVKVTIFLN